MSELKTPAASRLHTDQLAESSPAVQSNPRHVSPGMHLQSIQSLAPLEPDPQGTLVAEASVAVENVAGEQSEKLEASQSGRHVEDVGKEVGVVEREGGGRGQANRDETGDVGNESLSHVPGVEAEVPGGNPDSDVGSLSGKDSAPVLEPVGASSSGGGETKVLRTFERRRKPLKQFDRRKQSDDEEVREDGRGKEGEAKEKKERRDKKEKTEKTARTEKKTVLKRLEEHSGDKPGKKKVLKRPKPDGAEGDTSAGLQKKKMKRSPPDDADAKVEQKKNLKRQKADEDGEGKKMKDGEQKKAKKLRRKDFEIENTEAQKADPKSSGKSKSGKDGVAVQLKTSGKGKSLANDGNAKRSMSTSKDAGAKAAAKRKPDAAQQKPPREKPLRKDADEKPPRKDADEKPARRDKDEKPPRKDADEKPARRDKDEKPPRRDADEKPPRRDADEKPPRRDADEKPRRRDADLTRRKQVSPADADKSKKSEESSPSSREQILKESKVKESQENGIAERKKPTKDSSENGAAEKFRVQKTSAFAKKSVKISVVSERKAVPETPAPGKLTDDGTNKIRQAYEAAKELKQRLAQKDGTASASMKVLNAATQVKQSEAGAKTSSPLFLSPDKPSPLARANGNDRKHAARSMDKQIALETFEGMLETLTRQQESISKVTSFAMECTNKGIAEQIMEVVLRKLEAEREHKKRVDLLFLVDSMAQYHYHKKTSGTNFAPIVEECLARFLTAVAPPNSSSENFKQCVKVVNVWRKRNIMNESLLKETMATLEAGLNTIERQYQRQDRAIHDPVRLLDGDMVVDEYGSNEFSDLLPRMCISVGYDEYDDTDYGEKHANLLGNLDGMEEHMEDASPAHFSKPTASPPPSPPLSPPPLPPSPPPSPPRHAAPAPPLPPFSPPRPPPPPPAGCRDYYS